MRSILVITVVCCLFPKLWTVNSQSGVAIWLMGVMLTNGTGQFCVRDIGLGSDSATEAGDALVCVTENTMCCRAADGSPGGVGEWFINGSRVPGSYEKSYEIVFRNRGTGLVRLNVQSNHTSTQVGDYCCEIPDYNGVTQRLCVHGTLDDAVCSDPTLKTACLPNITQSTTVEESEEDMTSCMCAPKTISTVEVSEEGTTSCTRAPEMTTTVFSLVGVIAVLSVIIFILVATLITVLYKYHNTRRAMIVSHRDTYSTVLNVGKELSGTHDEYELTDMNREALKLSENEEYDDIRSSSVALQSNIGEYEYVKVTDGGGGLQPRGYRMSSARDNHHDSSDHEMYSEVR